MRAISIRTVTAAGVALTLSVPILVRNGGRSVIGFVASGSVQPGALLIVARLTPSTGVVVRSLAGTGGSPRSTVNGQTGQGSVNGATMRMMNSAAKNFLSAKVVILAHSIGHVTGPPDGRVGSRGGSLNQQ